MSITRIKFSSPFKLPHRIQLPPALPYLPQGTVLAEGYRLYQPDDARRLLGFYLPGRGIYDLEGKRIGKPTAGRRGCSFIREGLKIYLVDDNNKRIGLIALKKVRVALETTSNRVAGILQPIEFNALSHDIHVEKTLRKIAAFLKSES